jgi:methionyl-tRNA formyltransferase
MTLLDLYLGSPLGLWALDQVTVDKIGTVVTTDAEIAGTAQARHFRVEFGSPDQCDAVSGSVGLSVHYPHIFPETFLNKYWKMYNLHPGYLPWGRGYYPVFWALWDGEAAGATLHEIDSGVDTGPIVAQIRVDYSDADTGGSLHGRVRAAEERLFREYWHRIASGEALLASPQQGIGSFHTKAAFLARRRPANWRSLSAEDLLRLARALTFPGYPGLEIDLDGHVMEVCVKI